LTLKVFEIQEINLKTEQEIQSNIKLKLGSKVPFEARRGY
jgi:hypothetical protein